MVDHFQEGDGHCEQHPKVDHLDVGGDRHALRESEKSAKNVQIQLTLILTYMVAKASITVTLT